MEIAELNPHVRYIGRRTPSPFNPEYGVCYECRLFYITGGNGSVKIKNGEDIILKKNTLVFFPPNTVYKFFPQKNAPIDLLVFDFDLTTENFEQKKTMGSVPESKFDPSNVLICQTPDAFKTYIVQEDNRLVVENLLKAEEAHASSNPNLWALVSAYLKLALIYLVSDTTDYNASAGIVNAVCTYIKQNNVSKLTNEEIAKEFHYHPHYLSKIMKEKIGLTLHQYIIYNKILNAKKLLISTDLSVETIAWKVGFSSTSYFIKMFNRETGKTPKQYRSQKQKTFF